MGSSSHTWFDNEGDAFTLNLPAFSVGQFLVWKSRLAPAGVQKTDATIFIAHIGDGSFDNAALEISELQRCSPSARVTTLRG